MQSCKHKGIHNDRLNGSNATEAVHHINSSLCNSVKQESWVDSKKNKQFSDKRMNHKFGNQCTCKHPAAHYHNKYSSEHMTTNNKLKQTRTNNIAGSSYLKWFTPPNYFFFVLQMLRCRKKCKTTWAGN